MSRIDEDEEVVQIGIKIPKSLYRKLKFYCFIHQFTYADLIRHFLRKEVGDVDTSVLNQRARRSRMEILGLDKKPKQAA